MTNEEMRIVEKEMANFNFEELESSAKKAQKSFASATSAADITSQICEVWKKARKYVKLAEALPYVGRFVKILADLLDSFCNS